jgi:hypothetical protein
MLMPEQIEALQLAMDRGGFRTSIVTRPSRPCSERIASKGMKFIPNSDRAVPGTGGTHLGEPKLE